MKFRRIILVPMLAAACWSALAAGQLPDKDPIISSTGRFGDPSSIARKYQDYMYGVIKEMNPNELILTKTKFGVDQTFKLTKKTKFTLDNKSSTFANLKVGDKVYIDVDKSKHTGNLIAKKVVSGIDIPSIPSAE